MGTCGPVVPYLALVLNEWNEAVNFVQLGAVRHK